MFDLDLTKFAFLNSPEHESLGRKSSNLPRPRLSKKNLKLHSKRFDQQSQIRVEIESASSCNDSSDTDEVEIDDTLKTNFDYDYASIYSEFSDCDSGHQTVSGCGSGCSRNKTSPIGNKLLAPSSPGKSRSARFRSVSFNEDEQEQDEDGYSFVSYNSASAPGKDNKTKTGGAGESRCGGGSTENRVTIVGSNFEVLGPFGPRKCVYLDQGRAVSEIETFIEKNVFPFYSKGTTNSKLIDMRDEARQIIHERCGGCEEDEVIFCHGSNPIEILSRLMKKPKESSPVVILGPFQSSSAISAWKMVAHEVVIAPVNSNGQVDLKQLEGSLKSLKLKQIFKSRAVIGSFSVASNISGMLNNDDVAITALLHKFGAFSVWDYGGAGPHLEIQINPETANELLDKAVRKDAIFFSGSKFLGGPQTPDVLIAKKSMCRNQEYFADLCKSRSTNLIQEIRMGLVFQLQNSIGHPTIIGKETDFMGQVLDALGNVPEIVILGSTQTHRLPIISFLVKHSETEYFLHHEFVAALLRDLFGIQSTTGSMGDSPHAQQLLGIEDKLAKKYEQGLIQPGFTTIVLSHTATQAEITFTLDAVKLLATQGWKLLPFYEMDSSNGRYRFSGNMDSDKSQKLSLKSFLTNSLTKKVDSLDKKPISNYRYDECLTYGKDLIDSIEMITQHNEITHSDDISSFLDNPSLRWFLTPSEALLCIKHPYNVKNHFGTQGQKGNRCPFSPQRFNNNSHEPVPTTWTTGSIPYNYDALSTPTIPPLPPRLFKKSSSLKSLDMKVNVDAKKVTVRGHGIPFSRREFQSQLNNNYFGTP